MLRNDQNRQARRIESFQGLENTYPALSELPATSGKKSWFEFDHYYSDKAFSEVLPIISAKPVKELFDIGGNTGKWGVRMYAYNAEVHVTIIDLPEQIANLKNTLDNKGDEKN